MASGRRRIVDSWPVFCGVATFTFTVLGASEALSIVDAATLDLKVKTWGAISTAAAALGAFALLSVIVLTVCRLGCSGTWFHRWILPWTCFLVSVVAAVFSINALVLKAINRHEVEHEQHGKTDVVAQFALWGVAVAAQIFFYALVMLRQVPTEAAQTSLEEREKNAPQRPPTPPTPLRIASRQMSSSPPSKAPSKRSSWRDSLLSLKPGGSQTALLASRTTLSRSSTVRSSETARSDPFDSYVITQHEMSITANAPQMIPTKGTTLETIPGSRPASPAKALDGPFPAAEAGSSTPQTDVRPPTAQSQNSSYFPPKRTFIPASRPMSPAGDESHIHPLFRTDSPTPPPGISTNTIVTASPMGGQTMPSPVLSRPATRQRSASQLSNRAPSRAGSRAPSRASSFDDVRRAQSPLIPQGAMLDSSMLRRMGTTSTHHSSRSPSPVSRGLTPPIPEFILSARQEGPRSKSSKETLRSSPPR